MLPTRPPKPELAQSFRDGGHWTDHPIGHFLTRAAQRYPMATAVADGDRRLTFADIDLQATRLAAALRARGVTADDVVSFQLPNCAEAVIVFQAVMKLGAVANPIVPIYRSRELRFILGQSRAKVVFIAAELRGVDVDEMYRDLAAELPDLEWIISLGETSAGGLAVTWADLMDSVSTQMVNQTRAIAPPAADDVCLLLYTSGTTADPKGALHSHNTLVYENRSMIDWFSLNETDVIFNPSPVTHVTGINCALILPFVLGAPVVLQDAWDPAVALQRIVDEHCSFMIFSTPFLRGLLDVSESTGTPTPSIRYIVCGGADIPDALTAAATDRLGTVVRMYGATEGPSVSTADRWDPLYLRISTDGRPMGPTELVVAGGNGGLAQVGEVGEIMWRGPDTFLGYLESALNAAAFTADGFFRTGDLGRFDSSGAIHIVGRIKDIINRSGEKISAHDVENQLSEHPAVVEVAVVAGPDPRTGERGCAFVVTRDHSDLTLGEVHSFLLEREIAVQKIPESVFVVDSLPKTASGKVQKFALRDWTRDRDALPPQMATMTFAATHEK
ncbi:cyclohexanecarboxylate-CoA ligase [Williamsia limnetica]|uniref:Cyclohexanecarboxylate-CoA ligase n=1 Tax=Williamsia limnetica TaxID=882452 RepID=A0A318RFR2_WILLI|nr:AMP-binding protein [Williamsia limnetica]PYE12798.1 cyclohexanecarboxylate-CoA ligase [Williamsia limnetica]